MAVTLQFKLRGRAQALELDATLSTGHTSKVAVTKHPVETGSKIADNVRPDEQTVEIEGFITDTPLFETLLGERFAKGEARRTTAAILTLYALQEQAVLITVITPRRVYRNMILQSLSIPEERSEAVKFTGTFESVRFATTQTVLNPALNQGKDKQSGGSQPTRNAGAPVAQKSWLWNLGDTVNVQSMFTPTGG